MTEQKHLTKIKFLIRESIHREGYLEKKKEKEKTFKSDSQRKWQNKPMQLDPDLQVDIHKRHAFFSTRQILP